MSHYQTAKQLAADRANLAKARAAKKGKPLTAKARAADLRNLAKARAAYRTKHPYHHKARFDHLATPRAYKKIRPTDSHVSHAPLGDHRVGSTLRQKSPPVRKPTGINPRFKKRLAPTSFDQRGGWKSAKTHHYKKRLRMRKARRVHPKTWRVRKDRLTPK